MFVFCTLQHTTDNRGGAKLQVLDRQHMQEDSNQSVTASPMGLQVA